MDKEKAVVLGIAQTRFREEFKRTQHKKKVLPAIARCVLAVLIVLVILLAGFAFSICRDSTMTGKVENGQIVVSDRFAYLINKPERGEVISFWLAGDNGGEQIVQRRIVGLPGDEVSIRGGYVYINGHRCLEEYATGATKGKVTTVTVPSNTYYVLCDDRDAGPDSRDEMYVLSDSIIGSVVYSVSLPDKITNSPVIKAITAISDYL